MNIDEIVGDTIGFFAEQKNRLEDHGIDRSGCPLSHLGIDKLTHRRGLALPDRGCSALYVDAITDSEPN